MSYIPIRSTQAAITHLIACSRPAQIPLTYTLTFSIPWRVLAFEQALSAVICAAYGVASRAHLNQLEPQVAQVRTFHSLSETTTWVLL